MKRLIVFMHGLGDNLMLTPSIREIKTLFPDDEIHIGGFKYLSSKMIWENNPHVTKYYELNIDFHPTYWDEKKLNEEMKIIQPIIDELAKKIKADKVNFVTIKNKTKHEIGAIGEELGVIPSEDMEIFVSKEDEKIAEELINSNTHLKEGKFFVIHQGAGNYSKSWCEEECMKFMNMIERKSGYIPFIIDNPNEPKIEYENAIYASSLKKKTPGAIVEIMRKAKFFVGTDSFPMHLDTACEIPLVGLFVHTWPHRTGPLTKNSMMLCSLPTYTRTPLNYHYYHSDRMMLANIANNLQKIKAEKVLKAIERLGVDLE